MSRLAMLTDALDSHLQALSEINEALIVIIAGKRKVLSELGIKESAVQGALNAISDFVSDLLKLMGDRDYSSEFLFVYNLMKESARPLNEWRDALMRLSKSLSAKKCLSDADIMLLEEILTVTDKDVIGDLDQLRNF